MKYIVQFNNGQYVIDYGFRYDASMDSFRATKFESATQASAFIVNHALEGKSRVMMLDAKGNVGPLL